MSKQLQFELWQECNSLCKFCYLGSENRCTPDRLKLSALKSAYEKISDLSIYKEYDTLSYLGGEFFQGQLNNEEIRSEFMKLMRKTADLLNDGIIKNVWIYATMTIGDQKDLYDTINLFKKKDGLWILTSYDTYGRFHTNKMENNWSYHMLNIQNLYPEIKFNITTILSGDLIEKYLNNKFSFKDMIKKYKCSFFLKQCGCGPYTKEEMNKRVPNFFPQRKRFIEFLKKFRNEEDDLMWTKLFNIHYRADSLYRNYNNDDRRMELSTRYKEEKQEEILKPGEDLSKCGHMKNYAAYIDSDRCCLCDKIMIERMSN